MKQVELYAKVRYAVRIEGLSERAAARRFGIDPRTVSKMVAFSVPPGYRRTKPPVRPKLDAFIAIIDRILAEAVAFHIALRNRVPDAARSAGDQSNFAVELHDASP